VALLAVAVAGALVALPLTEGLLRLVRPQHLYGYDKGLFVEDARTGYRLAPSREGRHRQADYDYVIRTNALGFRGPESRPDAARRVLIVGDSYAFGQGVREGRTVADLLRADVAARGLDVDVVNTAAPGYNFDNEAAMLRLMLPAYRPQLVVVFFCWNDGFRSLHVVDGYLRLARTRAGHVREWLNNHSHLYALVKTAYYERFVAARDTPRYEFSGSALDAFARTLRQMRDDAVGHGASFIPVIVPARGVGVDDPAWQATRAAWHARLDAARLAAVDLEAHFLALPAGARRGLIFRNDLHWNEDGSRFVASVISGEVMTALAKIP
jgi:hypothetical protein